MKGLLKNKILQGTICSFPGGGHGYKLTRDGKVVREGKFFTVGLSEVLCKAVAEDYARETRQVIVWEEKKETVKEI